MTASFLSPRFLWFCAWILAALSSARANQVAPDLARRVAAAWSAENAALAPDFGEALDAVPVTDANGLLLWYEVPTAGGGCLVVAPDTDLEPVIAAIPDYEGGIPEGHPLRALLEADMRQRLSVLDGAPVLRTATRAATPAASSATSAEVAAAKTLAGRKWARLADDASLAPAEERDGRDAPLVFASSDAAATPARVYSFIDEWKRPKLTHWNQNGWNSFGSWDSVYDLYTPNHYPCGCVATAGAALLQFFNVTTAPSFSNVCYVDGAKTTLTTKGGTYDWSKLPTTWDLNQTLTDEQKDILGRATYDMGVCLGMSYESDGSGAPISTLATVLREKYGFADARCVYGLDASHYEKLIYAQVRCGYPVVLSIWNNSIGHAVLAVGYGEDADAAAYTRVFMGWGGSGDAWYALPNVSAFTTLDGIVTMIGTTTATVPVCGRVTDENGTGDGFASVSRYNSSASYTTVMANELGAWGTRVSPTLASAARKVACKGVTRTYSIGSSAATGQSYYTADTLCAALPDILTLTVPSERILPVQTTISAACEKAVTEGKLVFVFGGTQWCGNCAQLKKYLNALGTDFTDRFVLCYLDMEEEQPAAMQVWSYPTYGLFDPRRLGEAGWTPANGLLAEDSGWNQSRVDALLENGWAAWTSVDRSPTGLVLTLPSAIVSPTTCSAEAVFADGETYPLTSGVSWSVTGTAATLSGGVLAPVSGMDGTVTVRATATLAGKTLSQTAAVRVVKPSNVAGLVVSGPDVIDLYDVTGAQFTALATLSDGSFANIAVDWTVTESAVTNAVVSSGGYVDFPTPSKYTKASRLTVTARFGSYTASATADVWGWSATIAACTAPQRTFWPGQTMEIAPVSVRWWRHGVTEEPTTDFSGVDFSYGYGWINGETYVRGVHFADGDRLAIPLPADLSEPDGSVSMCVLTEATRMGRTVEKYNWFYFNYLASAPAQMVSVTFDANGGEPETQASRYAAGYAYGYFPKIVRTGYSCDWYTAAEGGTRVTADSNCNASVTRLYARWSPNYYYVSYNPNGGTGSMNGQYFYYDTPANLRATAFTKAGSVFAGWATEPDGEVVFEDEADILNLYDTYHSLTLYAKWVANGYRIVFDANGGVGTMPSQICRVGTCSSLAPASFTRRGATFAGWSRTPDGAAEFSDRSEVCDLTTAVGATVTLYAAWRLPDVASIELSGPDAIDLYDVDSAQFSATCRLADGSVVNVATRWSVEETAVTNALVSTDGLVSFPDPETYTRPSRLTVTAECNGVRASRTVDVWGWSATLAAWTMPQRTLWPGMTVRVVPQSVAWWRHGVTEEPTTDFSGVEFSFYGYVHDTQWHYLSGGETASLDELAITIPSDLESEDGYGYMTVYTRAERRGAVVSKGIWGYFNYLSSAPARMVSVTFDANGGEPALQTSLYAVGIPYGYLPTLASRTGYYSPDWYTEKEGGTCVTTASNCVVSLTRLFARWSPRHYRVDYDANGGNGSMGGNNFYYDTPANLRANAFTKVGHTFGGWSMEPGGAAVFEDRAAVLNLASVYTNITLYAVWNPGTYTVTLNAQNGTGGSASATATYGAAMPAITVPTRTGYTFGGYYTSANGGGTRYYTATGASARAWDRTSATTLYAKWTANSYALSFDRQDGTGGSATATATYGSAMPAITVPTRTGYTFGGYFSATDGGGTQYYTAAGASARAWDRTSATTLYAKWTGNTYTVTLDRQSGTGGSATATATYGSAMPAITVPTRTGYAFGGYYTAANGGGTQYYTADGASARVWNRTSATTLYAKWTGNTYTVSLNRQSGTGGSASATATYGAAMPAITVPTRAGYTFGGYYTSANGGGTQYYTAAGASARAWDLTSTTTLYAKWTPVTYTVTLNAQNGTGGSVSATATYGSAMPAITVPTRTGYTFGGYYTSTNGGGTQYYTADGTSARNWDKTATTTLYAKWTARTYEVTLDSQGGEGGTASVTATFGSAMPAIEVPVLDGLFFSGYFAEPDGGGVQYYTVAGTSVRAWDVPAATTLHAYWTEAVPSSVHRFYSPRFKGHFFTIDENEKENIRAHDRNWNYEGEAYCAYTNAAPGTVALHRFYSANYRGHFFTINEDEKNDIIAKNWRNWKYEGIAYYVYPEAVEGAVPVYRFWSARFRHHFYTIDEDEKENIRARDRNWEFEGTAFWALPAAETRSSAAASPKTPALAATARASSVPEDDSASPQTEGKLSAGERASCPSGAGMGAETGETPVPPFAPWSLTSQPDGAAVAIPGETDLGGVFVETRGDAPEFADLWPHAEVIPGSAGFQPAEPSHAENAESAEDIAGSVGFQPAESLDAESAEEVPLRLALPDGLFDAQLWSITEGLLLDEAVEGTFDFELSADGEWRWLRVRDADDADAFSLWLRAE